MCLSKANGNRSVTSLLDGRLLSLLPKSILTLQVGGGSIYIMSVHIKSAHTEL